MKTASASEDFGEFATSRLAVRRWAGWPQGATEAEHLARELGRCLAPEVVSHLPEPLQPAAGPAPLRAWVAARLSESRLYLVRDSGSAGLVGLMILAEGREVRAEASLRLGYLLDQSAWNNGYATELVGGLLASLAAIGWTGTMLAGVDRSNSASMRVLVKAGFGELPGSGGEHTALFSYVFL